MHDLSGQTITKISVDGPLTISTDAGWDITIESDFTYTTPDGTALHLVGDEPHTAEILAPVLIGRTIQSTRVNESEGLTMVIAPNSRLAAPPDDKFEAWNIVGPQSQLTVSMPGGELAIWSAVTPDA